MIQLSDLRVFLEVAASGSFSEAARRLKMPKSSVNRQIDRLETTVGAALFRRSARVVVLSPEGREFQPHARRLLGNGIEAENVLRSRVRKASGLLSISATASFARPFLVPYLPEFQARNPEVEIALWLTTARMEVGTGEGQVDIAIRLRSAAGPDLGTRKLGEIHFWLVASPGYLAVHGTPAVPADLKEHRIIELGPPNKAPQFELHRGTEVVTLRHRPRLRLDEPEATCIAAEAGSGVAILPGFVAAAAVASGRLVRMLPDWAPAPIPVNILYRTDVAPPIRVSAYVDYLFETVGQGQLWGGGG